MKNIVFKLFLTANLFLLLAVMPRVAKAQYGCDGQYNNCPQSQSIVVDKLVGMPANTKGGAAVCDSSVSYRDNYSSSDAKFQPSNFVCFQVKVKNTSNVTQNDITAKDFMPEYVTAIEGAGTYDAKTRTVTINAGDFGVNEEKIYYLKAQIAAQAQLPADKGLMCLVNKAQAYNNNVSDDDTAQFCVEKTVTPGKVTPSSGPELGLVLLAGNGLLAGLGIYLKKKTS